MPVREEFIGGVEEWREVASAVAGTATATHAAEADKNHYVTGFSISFSGPVAAGILAEIRRNAGATPIRQFQIPAATFAPIIYEFKRVLKIPVNQSVDINLPSAGAGVTGRVELLGFTRPAAY